MRRSGRGRDGMPTKVRRIPAPPRDERFSQLCQATFDAVLIHVDSINLSLPLTPPPTE